MLRLKEIKLHLRLKFRLEKQCWLVDLIVTISDTFCNLHSQQTDFLLTVCVTVRSHYSSGLLPGNPVLDEALVRVQGQDSIDKSYHKCWFENSFISHFVSLACLNIPLVNL